MARSFRPAMAHYLLPFVSWEVFHQVWFGGEELLVSVQIFLHRFRWEAIVGKSPRTRLALVFTRARSYVELVRRFVYDIRNVKPFW